jgi:hypothetical protein
MGYGQQFNDWHPRRGGRRDINEELVRRVASMTAWQIRKDAERRQWQMFERLLCIGIGIVIGLALGHHLHGTGF